MYVYIHLQQKRLLIGTKWWHSGIKKQRWDTGMLLNRHSGCAAFHNQRINKFKNLPLHVTPSPLYPGLQAHVKDPSVLVQEALGSQGNWTIHSSMSADGKIVRKTRLKHCEPPAPAVISKLITSYNRSRHCYESVAAHYTLVHGLSCLMGGLPERTGQCI